MPGCGDSLDELRIFAFGSLIGDPEYPELLRARLPARLPGVRRSFNKRSRTRHCPVSESFAAFPEVADGFLAHGSYQSLVLGTVDDPTGSIAGALLCYPLAARDRVLRATDRREGYSAGGDPTRNGYCRCTRWVLPRAADGEAVTCEVYLSNPDPRHCYYLPPEMTLGQRARVLINATPRKRSASNLEGDTRGLYYLEDVRRALRVYGIVDADLEALVTEVLALPGAWRAIVGGPV